jgi:outer membrane lipase/esterase
MKHLVPAARKTLAAAILGALAVLSACGDADTFEPVQPVRLVSFGDSLSDLGSVGGARWTVNGVTNNIWVETLAANYGLTISAAAAGGTGYGEGLACVAASGGAAGLPCASKSVRAQIDTFLAAQVVGDKDLFALQAGANDIIAAVTAFTGGTLSAAGRDAALDAAADALSGEVTRLVGAGAKQVALTNVPNIGLAPFGAPQAAVYGTAVRRFNDRLKINLVGQGQNVLLLDLELFFNREINNTGLERSTPVCTVSPVTSCNTSTVIPGADITLYVFADTLRPTPAVHQRFGLEAYNQLRNRF